MAFNPFQSRYQPNLFDASQVFGQSTGVFGGMSPRRQANPFSGFFGQPTQNTFAGGSSLGLGSPSFAMPPPPPPMPDEIMGGVLTPDFATQLGSATGVPLAPPDESRGTGTKILEWLSTFIDAPMNIIEGIGLAPQHAYDALTLDSRIADARAQALADEDLRRQLLSEGYSADEAQDYLNRVADASERTIRQQMEQRSDQAMAPLARTGGAIARFAGAPIDFIGDMLGEDPNVGRFVTEGLGSAFGVKDLGASALGTELWDPTNPVQHRIRARDFAAEVGALLGEEKTNIDPSGERALGGLLPDDASLAERILASGAFSEYGQSPVQDFLTGVFGGTKALLDVGNAIGGAGGGARALRSTKIAGEIDTLARTAARQKMAAVVREFADDTIPDQHLAETVQAALGAAGKAPDEVAAAMRTYQTTKDEIAKGLREAAERGDATTFASLSGVKAGAKILDDIAGVGEDLASGVMKEFTPGTTWAEQAARGQRSLFSDGTRRVLGGAATKADEAFYGATSALNKVPGAPSRIFRSAYETLEKSWVSGRMNEETVAALKAAQESAGNLAGISDAVAAGTPRAYTVSGILGQLGSGATKVIKYPGVRPGIVTGGISALSQDWQDPEADAATVAATAIGTFLGFRFLASDMGKKVKDQLGQTWSKTMMTDAETPLGRTMLSAFRQSRDSVAYAAEYVTGPIMEEQRKDLEALAKFSEDFKVQQRIARAVETEEGRRAVGLPGIMDRARTAFMNATDEVDRQEALGMMSDQLKRLLGPRLDQAAEDAARAEYRTASDELTPFLQREIDLRRQSNEAFAADDEETASAVRALLADAEKQSGPAKTKAAEAKRRLDQVLKEESGWLAQTIEDARSTATIGDSRAYVSARDEVVAALETKFGYQSGVSPEFAASKRQIEQALDEAFSKTPTGAPKHDDPAQAFGDELYRLVAGDELTPEQTERLTKAASDMLDAATNPDPRAYREAKRQLLATLYETRGPSSILDMGDPTDVLVSNAAERYVDHQKFMLDFANNAGAPLRALANDGPVRFGRYVSEEVTELMERDERVARLLDTAQASLRDGRSVETKARVARPYTIEEVEAYENVVRRGLKSLGYTVKNIFETDVMKGMRANQRNQEIRVTTAKVLSEMAATFPNKPSQETVDKIATPIRDRVNAAVSAAKQAVDADKGEVGPFAKQVRDTAGEAEAAGGRLIPEALERADVTREQATEAVATFEALEPATKRALRARVPKKEVVSVPAPEPTRLRKLTGDARAYINDAAFGSKESVAWDAQRMEAARKSIERTYGQSFNDAVDTAVAELNNQTTADYAQQLVQDYRSIAKDLKELPKDEPVPPFESKLPPIPPPTKVEVPRELPDVAAFKRVVNKLAERILGFDAMLQESATAGIRSAAKEIPDDIARVFMRTISEISGEGRNVFERLERAREGGLIRVVIENGEVSITPAGTNTSKEWERVFKASELWGPIGQDAIEKATRFVGDILSTALDLARSKRLGAEEALAARAAREQAILDDLKAAGLKFDEGVKLADTYTKLGDAAKAFRVPKETPPPTGAAGAPVRSGDDAVRGLEEAAKSIDEQSDSLQEVIKLAKSIKSQRERSNVLRDYGVRTVEDAQRMVEDAMKRREAVTDEAAKLISRIRKGQITGDEVLAEASTDLKVAMVRRELKQQNAQTPAGHVSYLDILEQNAGWRQFIPPDVETIAQYAQMHVPINMAEDMRNVARLGSMKPGDGPLTKLTNAIDKLTSFARATFLSMPASIANDIIGNTIVAQTIGGGWRRPANTALVLAYTLAERATDKLLSTAEAAKLDAWRDAVSAMAAPLYKAGQKLGQVKLKGYTGDVTLDDLFDEFRATGIMDRLSTITAEAEGRTGPVPFRELESAPAKAGEALKRGRDVMFGLREFQDNAFRFFHYVLGRTEMGLSRADAMSRANMFVFDYTDVTKFEREKMRKAFLFYTFMKKSLPLWTRNLAEDPTRLRWLMLATGMESSGDPEAKDTLIERIGGHRLGTKNGIPQYLSINGGLLTPSLSMLEGDSATDIAANFGAAMSPFYRAAIEIPADRDLFSGKRLGFDENAAGEFDTEARVPPWVGAAAEALPAMKEFLGVERAVSTDGEVTGYRMHRPMLRYILTGVVPIFNLPVGAAAGALAGADPAKETPTEIAEFLGQPRVRGVAAMAPDAAMRREISKVVERYKDSVADMPGKPFVVTQAGYVNPNTKTQLGQQLKAAMDKAERVIDEHAQRIPNREHRAMWKEAMRTRAMENINPQWAAVRQLGLRLAAAKRAAEEQIDARLAAARNAVGEEDLTPEAQQARRQGQEFIRMLDGAAR